MTVERGVRLMAGFMVLLSLALAHYVSVYWLWLTAFVSLNLVAIGIYKLVSCDGNLSRHGHERCRLRHRKVKEI